MQEPQLSNASSCRFTSQIPATSASQFWKPAQANGFALARSAHGVRVGSGRRAPDHLAAGGVHAAGVVDAGREAAFALEAALAILARCFAMGRHRALLPTPVAVVGVALHVYLAPLLLPVVAISPWLLAFVPSLSLGAGAIAMRRCLEALVLY